MGPIADELEALGTPTKIIDNGEAFEKATAARFNDLRAKGDWEWDSDTAAGVPAGTCSPRAATDGLPRAATDGAQSHFSLRADAGAKGRAHLRGQERKGRGQERRARDVVGAHGHQVGSTTWRAELGRRTGSGEGWRDHTQRFDGRGDARTRDRYDITNNREEPPRDTSSRSARIGRR